MTLSIDSNTSSLSEAIVPTKEVSYFYRLQNLICRMTEQLSRLSAESSRSMDEKKKEFRACSAKAADLIDQKGNTAPWGSAASLTIVVASIALGVNEATMKIASSIADQMIPSGVGCYTSHLDAEQFRKSQLAQLRQTDIQNEGAKSGDTVSVSTALGELSRALLDGYRKASG